MMGEVVVPLRKELAENLTYYRKVLPSFIQMRFISLSLYLFQRKHLAGKCTKIKCRCPTISRRNEQNQNVQITQKQSNSVFYSPKPITDKLRERYFSTIGMKPQRNAFGLLVDTTENDISSFIDYLKQIAENDLCVIHELIDNQNLQRNNR